MSLIVFGGSFDPPHRAHLRLLRAALLAQKDSRAVVVPAHRSPLKQAARVSGNERLALVRAALNADLPASLRKRVAVESYEIARARTTYSYETLRHLHGKHPSEKLFFLCGSDALASLPAWERPREVAAAAVFLVGRRPGAHPLKKTNLKTRIVRLPGVFPAISSTEIRLNLLLGKPVQSLLSPAVLEAVHGRGLYGTALRGRLRAELSANRYAHTLAVARHAAGLAALHGLDAERAALAGLLHDCGRAIPVPKMADFVLRRRIQVPARAETIRRAPLLLHAHISEFRARTVYGITDPAVLSAVRKHTLGDPAMAPLDRLLYTADSCSPDRKGPGVGAVRTALRRGLDAGFAQAVRSKLDDILARGQWLHPSAAAVWNEATESL